MVKDRKKTDIKKETPKSDIAPTKPNHNNKRMWMVSIPVFAFAITIVVLNMVSVVFPALVQSSFSEFKELEFYSQVVDPFELGVLAVPFLVVNFALLGFGFLYYKKRWRLEKIFNFDVSQKTSLIILGIILAIYVAFSAGELGEASTWADFQNVEKIVVEDGIESLRGFDLYVRYSLLTVSHDVFGNIKVVPFMGSIALLIVTFFTVKEITQKRVAGIFSLLLVLQSNIFLTYDTSATYSNFWILFYLMSLYLIVRKWQFSHFAFILSLFSKSLTAAFLPVSMFFLFNNTSSKTRIYLAISYGALIGLGIIMLSNSNILFGSSVFLPENFWKGIAAISYQLRFDPIIIIFLLPLTVSLFLKSRAGFYQADSILMLISWVLLMLPLLITFTSQTNEPYRLMPLVVFFAVGGGVLLAKTKQQDV